MYILEEACSDASFAATILFIKKLVDIIFIIGPVLLILLLTIDFTKAVIEGSEEKTKHVKDTAIKRILFAVVLFFVPLIVDTSFELLDKDKGNVISCYNKVDNAYVDSLAVKLEAETKEKEAQRQKTIEDIKAKQKSEAERRANLGSKAAAKKASKSSSNVESMKGMENVCSDCNGSEKIAQTAEALAWKYKTPKKKWHYVYGDKKYFTKWSQLKKAKPTQAFMDAMDKVYPGHFKWATKYPAIRHGQSCDTFVGVVVKASGYDSIGRDYGTQEEKLKKHTKKWKKVSKSDCKRGDICRAVGSSYNHTYIYLGKGKKAEANYGDDYGRIIKGSCGMCNQGVYRAIG